MSEGKRAYVPVEQRRAQLVEAALRVLQRDGAGGLTTRAVADEAGVALGAVHYAFGAKADLVRAVFLADRDRATDDLAAAVARGGSASDMLVRAGRDYVARVLEDPATELAMQELTVLGARDEEYRAAAVEAIELYRGDAVTLLEDVAAASGGRWETDTRVLAESLTAHLFGLSLNWLCTRDDALFVACVEDSSRALAARLVV